MCDLSVAELMLTNCKYQVISAKDGEVKILATYGIIGKILPTGQTETVAELTGVAPFDNCLASPRLLGKLVEAQLPQNLRQLYEFACFNADNDSLEYRSLLRSGKVDLQCVQRARDAFSHQSSYRLRGLETSIPFDGNPDTVFDTKSRLCEIYHGKGYRIKGGCLRVDLGETLHADTLEIEFFDGLQNSSHVFAEHVVHDNAEDSVDLQNC